MERLEKDSPAGKPLSEEQKKRMEEIDIRYQAKFAEREVFLNEQIVAAQRAGDRKQLALLRRQLADEKITLDEDKEQAKEKIRQE